MYRHSLRTRVAIAFASCIAILSVVWGFAFFAAIKLSEDRPLRNQLERAVDSFPTIPTAIRRYDAVDDLPESIKPWAQTSPTEGIYEFEQQELHVAVVPVDGEQRDAFVVFDVAGIEASSAEDWWWLLVITGIVGVLGTLGFGLGMMVMGRAVAPVTQLAKRVEDIDPEKLSAEDYKRIDAHHFGDDEVGMLATTIEKTLERIGSFVERERDFASSASHELRTPITVISGALELLEQSELPKADSNALDRIRRATVEMRTTIELFLCLAHEVDGESHYETFQILPLVDQAIEQQRYLLNGRSLAVKLEANAQPMLHGYAQAFAIAVNNLIRNAFEHSRDGHEPIIVSLRAHELVVTNALSSEANENQAFADTSSNGYGLGLGIVQRLCERHGWLFSLFTNDTRVIARLSW